MPFYLSWEGDGVVFRFSGTVPDGDLLESNNEIYAHPHFPDMKYQVVDFSAIEEFDVSSAWPSTQLNAIKRTPPVATESIRVHVDRWTQEIARGDIPDFSPSLIY